MTSALIVEDTPAFQTIMSMALEYAGFDVEVVCNGADAMARLRDKEFHIMFLDLNMPVLSGGSVLRLIRSMDSYKHMFIVVVTANSYMSDSEIETLADFIMLKPLDVQDLAQFAQRLLTTSRSFRLDKA